MNDLAMRLVTFRRRLENAGINQDDMPLLAFRLDEVKELMLGHAYIHRRADLGAGMRMTIAGFSGVVVE
jgi:hypothetical protein